MSQDLENKYKEACKEIEKLKKENFGMKMTIKNLQERLGKLLDY